MELSPCQARKSTVNNTGESERELGEEQEYKPKDLSVKPNMKRMKPIPPPLNLKSDTCEEATTGVSGVSTALKEFAILATGPRSPLMQKNLPFRKRAHSVPDAVQEAPLSAPPILPTSFQIPSKYDASLDEDADWNPPTPPLNLSLPPTPKAFHTSMSAAASVSRVTPIVTSSEESTPQRTTSVSYLCPISPRPALPSMISDPGLLNMALQPPPRHHGQPWSPFLPTPSVGGAPWFNGSPSALLSPAPSSLGSSQEDLRLAAAHPLTGVSVSVPAASLGTFETEPWRLPWPHPVWHCFQAGTLVRLLLGGSELTARAEEMKNRNELESLSLSVGRLGPLRVLGIELVDRASAVDIKFSTVATNSSSEIRLVATCHLHHTFFVPEKGWCAVVPDAVYRQYGVHCQLLECLDWCMSPVKLPVVSSPGICDKFKRFSFSPEELSSPNVQQPGPIILSPPNTPTQAQHAHQSHTQPLAQSVKQQKTGKHKSVSSQPAQKPTQKSSIKCPLDPDRPKRPMNAFMLFAKQHRLKLIQMHPGKDNRFVSVILGEAWRQLPADQKEVFISEARALSHERKRLHPECWKRKRSQSTS